MDQSTSRGEGLGLEEIADVSQQTLDEEGQADKLLTRIAKSHVNMAAASR